MGTLNAKRTWDFFIAHAGADQGTAEQLYDLLVQESHVFLDSRCLELGDDWDTNLAAAQRSSAVTVVLVSSAAEQAYYQREEIAAAVALARKARARHRVVPVYLDSEVAAGDTIPYGLRLKHGLQLSDTLTLAHAASKLLALLRRTQSGRAGKESPPGAAPSRAADEARSQGMFHQPPETWSSPVRLNRWRYKVAAFDLDGTLLRGSNFEFSWEAIWRGLAFGRSIQNQLKRQYRQRSASDPSRPNRIRAYQEWCDKACDQFKRRGLTRDQVRRMSDPLSLTRNCREALAELRSQGVVTAIISGGVNTFLEDTFPDFRDHFDFVFINELVFSPAGALEGVRATSFDFQGKAEALDIVCERAGCTATEVVFVGDHFNDEAIMLKVDKAIAYAVRAGDRLGYTGSTGFWGTIGTLACSRRDSGGRDAARSDSDGALQVCSRHAGPGGSRRVDGAPGRCPDAGAGRPGNAVRRSDQDLSRSRSHGSPAAGRDRSPGAGARSARPGPAPGAVEVPRARRGLAAHRRIQRPGPRRGHHDARGARLDPL